MRRNGPALLGLGVGFLLLIGCNQPQEESEELGVPVGAVPAAPDVRPGTESAPGGVAPVGGEATAGDRATPSDTAVGHSVDTTAGRLP